MLTAEEVIQGVLDNHRFDKDGGAMLEELVRLHVHQIDSKARDELTRVYRNWLESGKPAEADWAAAMIRRLRLVDERPLLERHLRQIEIGESRLPQYYAEFLRSALDDLSR